MAERTIGTTVPTIQELAQKRCLSKAKGIIKDFTHPGQRLFSHLPLGRSARECLRSTSECRIIISSKLRLRRRSLPSGPETPRAEYSRLINAPESATKSLGTSHPLPARILPPFSRCVLELGLYGDPSSISLLLGVLVVLTGVADRNQGQRYSHRPQTKTE
ncbi:hypothetical protein UPYG_G00000820 [Umbra pygmaea]|uniref:Uncharacterized protein n=1 Tax=Umbra pygmaea TaxID=75934 RepID=A0ABD0XVD1_UMBPY